MTADIAVIAIAALCALDRVLLHLRDMKVADRVRVVSPPKAQQQDKGEAQAAPDTVRRLPA